jgi:hypothetical protein
MTLAQARRRTMTQVERIGALEQRTDAFEKMAEPLTEICEAWGRLKTINWFLVKVGAIAGGGLGFLAVVLTVAEKVMHFVK